MRNFKQHLLLAMLAAPLLAACGAERSAQLSEVSIANPQPGLKEHYQESFLLGTALNRAQIMAHASPEEVTQTVRVPNRGLFQRQQLITDPEGLEIALHNFNALTPENVMKWEEIHPEPGRYDFAAADRFVEIAEASGAYITAHALVWHNQTPDWVFEDEKGEPIGREALLARMREHIHTVVGRYRGRIQSWDVVNEALNMDGSMRESRWYQIIGEDYLVKAFEYAREADPDAELYYNDYSLEDPEKLEGAIRLAGQLQERGAPITGIGNQSHFSLVNFPGLEAVENTITRLAELDLDVMITELDINLLPSARGEDGELLQGTDIYPQALPEEVQLELAQRYRELFGIYLKHREKISRVTFWGFADADSWLNYLPMERVNHPLLFDRELRPKPAYQAVIQAAEKSRG